MAASKKPSAEQLAAIGDTKTTLKHTRVSDLGVPTGHEAEDLSAAKHYRLTNDVITETGGVYSWKADLMIRRDVIAKVSYAGAKKQITLAPATSDKADKDAVQRFVRTSEALLPSSRDSVNDLILILLVNGEKALTPHNRWLLVKDIPDSQAFAMDASLVVPVP